MLEGRDKDLLASSFYSLAATLNLLSSANQLCTSDLYIFVHPHTSDRSETPLQQVPAFSGFQYQMQCDSDPPSVN